MPDDPFDAIKGMVDPALQSLLDHRKQRNAELEKALRKAVKALERRAEPELKALAAELKGVLGDA